MNKHRLVFLILILLLIPAYAFANVKEYSVVGNVGTAPQEVIATVETTTDIRGIKVMDQNGNPVPTGIVQTQSASSKIWTLTVTVSAPCEDEWTVYLKSSGGKWNASDVSFYVSVSGTAAPAVTPKPAQAASAPAASLPTPAPCSLTIGSQSVIITIPRRSNNANIIRYDLYRMNLKDYSSTLIQSFSNGTPPFTFEDTSIPANGKYSYYYEITCDNGMSYPTSKMATVEWDRKDSTPKPTPKAADAALSVSAPDACQLEESTRGITIRIPPVSTTKTIASYDLYRIDETNAPWQARLIKSLSPSNLTYLDNNVSNGSSYSYYYVVVLKNGQNYPDSAVRSMKWTKGSSISNLRVWQDSNHIRRIHADWDDVVDAEYDVDIRINAYGNKSLKWHWSGLPYNTSDMFFRDAIPGTQYLVTVTEPISGKSLSQTIYLPKAPTYSRYGARPQGGTVTWISHADKQAAANVYRANFTYYQTLSSSEFNNKSKDNGLYYRSKWIYSKSSGNHELDAMIVLRSPSGKVVWEEWFGQELSAVNGSSTWEWVYPLDYLISEMKDWKSSNLLEPGEYTVEHYYDDMLVNSSTFIIR